jgi:hypothetical protein
MTTPAVEFLADAIKTVLVEIPNDDAAIELVAIMADYATGEIDEDEALADLQGLYSELVAP